MAAKLITFHIPKDREILAAVGEVAIRHEHLNYALKLMIKSLAKVSTEEALLGTNYQGSATLRERVRKLARQRLGEGAPLLKVQAIVTTCERLTKKRNELVHGVWAADLEGEGAHIRDSFGVLRDVPTAKELRDLADEIGKLVSHINSVRLLGWLAEALLASEKKPAKRK